MARSVDARKWRAWRSRMKRFEKAGRSVAEFCRHEGVSDASFYQWRTRLAGISAAKKGEAAGRGKREAAGAWKGKASGPEKGKASGPGKGKAAGPGKGKGNAPAPGKGKAVSPGRGRPAAAGNDGRADVTGGFSFTPVRLVAAASVAVHLPGGTQLRVPTSDPEVLRLVIDTLAHADAERAGGVRC